MKVNLGRWQRSGALARPSDSVRRDVEIVEPAAQRRRRIWLWRRFQPSEPWRAPCGGNGGVRPGHLRGAAADSLPPLAFIGIVRLVEQAQSADVNQVVRLVGRGVRRGIADIEIGLVPVHAVAGEGDAAAALVIIETIAVLLIGADEGRDAGIHERVGRMVRGAVELPLQIALVRDNVVVHEQLARRVDLHPPQAQVLREHQPLVEQDAVAFRKRRPVRHQVGIVPRPGDALAVRHGDVASLGH